MPLKTSVRSLTAIERDTLRVALDLLLATDAATLEQLRAEAPDGLLNDTDILRLRLELTDAPSVVINGVEP